MKLLKLLLYIYKNSLSPMLKFMFGGGCKYKITCSEYTVRQIEKKGFVLGGLKGLKRVIKCNSFNKL